MKHITSHKCVWTNLLYEFLSQRCSETRSLPTSDCSSFCSSKKTVNSSLRSLFFLEKVLLSPDLNCYVVNQGTLRYRNQFVSMSFFYIQIFFNVFSMKQYMFNPCYNMFSLSLTIFHSILFFLSTLSPPFVPFCHMTLYWTLIIFFSYIWKCWLPALLTTAVIYKPFLFAVSQSGRNMISVNCFIPNEKFLNLTFFFFTIS